MGKVFKIITLGEGAVGKTAIITRYVNDFFGPKYTITLGTNFLLKDLEVDGEEIRFQIWDIAGQQHFRSIRPFYYTGSNGALALFDLTRRNTLLSLFEWISELRKVRENIPIMIIGNKLDLEELREVSTQEAIDFVKSLACSGYIETSAKTGDNVEDSFEALARLLDEDVNPKISSPSIYYFNGWRSLESQGIGIFSSFKIESKPDEYKSLTNEFSTEQIEIINQKVEEILTTPPKEGEFRFLIFGNEDSQKPLLSSLLRVEQISWPPKTHSILYNTLKYTIKIDFQEYKFQLYFLSNIKKLKDTSKLFNVACKKADGVVIFYNPSEPEGFARAADMGKKLRGNDSELEIILTSGSDNPTTLFHELERLKKENDINNSDDYNSLISEVLINTLNRKKDINKEIKYSESGLKEIQNQLKNQKVRRKFMDFLLSMEKPEKTREIKPEKILKMDYIDDFAISFAGEDRSIARRIANALKNAGVKIFYDEFFESDLVGKKLSTYFQEKYGPQIRYLIVLISKYYGLKDWTNLELKIAREEAKVREDEFIIPIRLDDAIILGIHDDIGFIDYNKKGLDGTVKILLEKLKGAKLREFRD